MNDKFGFLPLNELCIFNPDPSNVNLLVLTSISNCTLVLSYDKVVLPIVTLPEIPTSPP